MTIRQAGNIIAGTVTNLIPVGTILPYGGSTAPEGYLLCNGQAVSRTIYSDLFDVIGTTYGTGDGNTTFNLPNLTNKFIEGGTAGISHNPGLPNITGGVKLGDSWCRDNSTLTSSALYSYDNDSTAATGSGKYNVNIEIGFDASLSNSIYGNSATVQPASLEMTMIIKF